MDVRQRLLLWSLLGLVGAAIVLALHVYPFQYGLVESTLVAGLFVFFGGLSGLLDNTRSF